MLNATDPPTHGKEVGRLTEGMRSSRTLQKLNEFAHSVAELHLVILVRIDDRMVELYPAGGDSDLPSFCQVYRETSEGEKRCLTCRSLVAFGACYRGLIEYTCHGGVSVVAAPALRRDGTKSDRVVVASCAFAQRSDERGWHAAKRHAEYLGLDIKRLKNAFFELPAVSEETRRFARGITETAASLVGEFEEDFKHQAEQHEQSQRMPDLDSWLGNIGLTRDRSYVAEGGSVGSVLVEQVIALVKRDPSMPFHVGNIARAAHVTPNYFSSIFSKHTGQTFRSFLSEQRVHLACKLLQDIRLTVREVAHRAGFRDPAYFSRRFKEVTGIAPTVWRSRTTTPEQDEIEAE